VPESRSERLRAVVAQATALPGIESAAIFISGAASKDLVLGAADGVAGPALDRLVEAVRHPEHPIARTMADGIASFDAMPMAPGGPALRSHLPLLTGAQDPANRPIVGVLAVAHELPVDADVRTALVELTGEAARAAD